MEKSLKALVFHGPWELAVEERPDPVAGDGEVLLRVLATGICGSDLHGFTGENGRRHPGQVMGHETVAQVETDGSATFEPGTLVTVNPVIGCGSCENCAQGEPQRCPDRRVIGVAKELSSAFAEKMVVPVGNVVVLPEGVPADVGGLVEPLAVGYHAARRAHVTGADAVLILGGGPIGQAAALAARRLGSEQVLVSEPDPVRRAVVELLGFLTVDPVGVAATEVAAALPQKPTVVLDAVGTTTTLQTALEASSLGARIVLVGMNAPKVELSAYAVSTEERSIIGSFCYNAREFAETADWAAAHAEELLPLIDGRVGLTGAPNAFTQLSKGELKASKVLVYLGSDNGARSAV